MSAVSWHVTTMPDLAPSRIRTPAGFRSQEKTVADPVVLPGRQRSSLGHGPLAFDVAIGGLVRLWLCQSVANRVGGGGRARGQFQFGEQIRHVVVDGAGTDREFV